ncbi:hypothetical protein CTI12_AA104080 [Artemisia annua]|uniref:Uncharacterized protein n=1 Tax=Artemisia annua TaxID=35608 RepID=A0A2U1PWC0_ARTAN|nr:hypothetical protein CTI12_AA104080 [Artemisia annua]
MLINVFLLKERGAFGNADTEETPKGNNIGENSFEGGSGSSGKRTIINLDEFDDEEYEARKGKRQMVEVKIEKE